MRVPILLAEGVFFVPALGAGCILLVYFLAPFNALFLFLIKKKKKGKAMQLPPYVDLFDCI